MLDIKDRIYEAISKFVETHSYEQSIIYLSRTDFHLLRIEAESSELGFFGNHGSALKFEGLVVKIHSRKDICVY